MKTLSTRSITPELDREDNLFEGSIISGITNLLEVDKESDPEMPITMATRMATRTVKTEKAIIAIPQVTCKLTAEKERQPELP